MSPKPDKRGGGYDAITLILSVAAFGLAILPVVLLAGGDPSVVIALGAAYGGVVTIAAPLYAKRQERRDDDERDRGERDG